MIGDQHAALFGQACFDRGMTKATFGTGSFVLMNVGATCPEPVDGLLTTVAWDLGTDGDVAIGADGGPRAGRSSLAYAVEGSVFVAGAGVQWLRDGLGIIAESAELEPLARTVDSSEGVVLVPAFTGLGSPHWDPGARGTITGLSRGTGRAHLARAMIEAMGFQVRDVLDAMAATGTRAVGGPGRRRGGGHGPAAPAPGRPGRASRSSGPGRSRPPRSVRPPWPDWPRGCGARSTTWPRCGPRRRRSPPRPTTGAVADRPMQAWPRSVERSRGWVTGRP